jgi:hypothetical protein
MVVVEFAALGGTGEKRKPGWHLMLTSLDKSAVIARSVATKQSNWIATARFAHLAMTKVKNTRDADISYRIESAPQTD